MPSNQSATADPTFSAQLQKLGGPEQVWSLVEEAVAKSVADSYQQVRSEMEGDGLGNDPDALPGMLVNLDPQKALQLLHQQNPTLDLFHSLNSNPLEVTAAVISMLADSN